MLETYGNFVNGAWEEAASGVTFAVRNPADETDEVGHFQESDGTDADRAVEAAAAASEHWAKTPGPARGDILRAASDELAARKEELAETLTREEGKTLSESRPEVQRAIDIFAYYAEKARDFTGERKAPSGQDKRLFTIREPMGVAALITPWNYPIAIPAWKLAPALATGNTVVFKPAMAAPNVARKLVECLEAAGIPDGVVNMVTGPGSEVGTSFIEHEAVDLVSFTGSKTVGDVVYDQATDDRKRVQTEMGGKNPIVVMPSADLDEAVELAGAGAFGVTGQACTATSRAIVHEAVYDEFVERIVAYAEELEIGPGLEDPDMGPQVSTDELEGTLDYVEVAEAEGATLETGGGRPGIEGGHFVEPTVFADVDSDMRIAHEEVFGPVLAVLSASDFESAMTIANDVQYGLSASIATQDLTEANRFIDDIEAGVAKVNEKTTGLELHVPFGGMKASSSQTYREQGDDALHFYTTAKTVYLNY
jgi:aldehyde dehydrogenase (NAD+)